MNNFRLQGVLIATLLAAGCATTSESEQRADNLRQQYEQLSSAIDSQRYAPVAFAEAEEALEEVDRLIDNGADQEEIEHQVYIAERKLEIARETATMQQADEIVANAGSQRKDVLLSARESELEEVTQRADEMAARANELEAQVGDMSTEETERGLVLTLDSILFEVNEAELKPGAQRQLSDIAAFLNEYPDRNIVVEGFTDSTGNAEYNQELSQQRAQAVRDVLANYGVSPDRVITRGYGQQFPVASNDSEVGRQQNRRVEIIIANGTQSVAERGEQ